MVELAIVIPTFNEKDNVQPLLAALAGALNGIAYEVLFVDDDSPDGTAEHIRSISQSDPRVRVLHRVNRRGLSSACVEGMMATAAPYIAVMDADLQHDETILPRMLAKIQAEKLDIVIASRNMPGGSMGDFARERVAISGLGKKFSSAVCHCEISDPMSGFFLLDRRFLEEVIYDISGIGFKILVDLIASAKRPVRIGEIPYRFRTRVHGESKLDILVLVEYVQLILDKVIGDVVPARFMLFGTVGFLGALVNLFVLAVLYRSLDWTFATSVMISTFAAMTFNFFLNNSITYRDRRLKGWGIAAGLVSFYVACSIGAFINFVAADFLRQNGLHWLLAGSAGIVISSVWNFGVTQMFTWRLGRRVARIGSERRRLATVKA